MIIQCQYTWCISPADFTARTSLLSDDFTIIREKSVKMHACMKGLNKLLVQTIEITIHSRICKLNVSKFASTTILHTRFCESIRNCKFCYQIYFNKCKTLSEIQCTGIRFWNTFNTLKWNYREGNHVYHVPHIIQENQTHTCIS